MGGLSTDDMYIKTTGGINPNTNPLVSPTIGLDFLLNYYLFIQTLLNYKPVIDRSLLPFFPKKLVVSNNTKKITNSPINIFDKFFTKNSYHFNFYFKFYFIRKLFLFLNIYKYPLLKKSKFKHKLRVEKLVGMNKKNLHKKKKKRI